MHESPWAQHDLEVALGTQRYEGTLCSCGYPFEETTGKENTFRFKAEYRYCHACKARESAERQASHDKHGRTAAGLKITVVDLAE